MENPMPDRRTPDPVVQQLVSDVAQLQKDMKENTAVTKEVRDILRAFKIMGTIAKWTGAFAGAGYAIMQFWQKLKGA